MQVLALLPLHRLLHPLLLMLLLLVLSLLLLLPAAAAAAPTDSTSTPTTTTTPPSKKPNFIIIYLDDAGWGDVGFNWHETPETKNLDALSTQGLRLTDFHSAASVCTPSRASLLTGRLGLRTGVVHNFRQGALGGLPLSEISIAELLKEQGGYHTAMIGKHHLGHASQYHPTFRGFERYLGVPYSVDMGCTTVPGADHPVRKKCCPWRADADGEGGGGGKGEGGAVAGSEGGGNNKRHYLHGSDDREKHSQQHSEHHQQHHPPPPPRPHWDPANNNLEVPAVEGPSHWTSSSFYQHHQQEKQQQQQREQELEHYPSSSLLLPPDTCINAPAIPLYNSTGVMCSAKASCNEDIVEQPVNLFSLARRYGEYAENYLEEMATYTQTHTQEGKGEGGGERQPFFLYVAMAHMHVPLAYDPQFENASPRADRRIYGNTLAEMDHEVGRIIQALHRTGLANDTLVLITSDNGPWDMKCNLAGLAGPYQGRFLQEHFKTASGKFTTWEGGHRVPALAYWPSHIAGGRVSDALTSTLDVFPTFASLAGVGLPVEGGRRGYDGVDLSGLFLMKGEQGGGGGGKEEEESEEGGQKEMGKRKNIIVDGLASAREKGGGFGHELLFHPDHYGNLTAMRLGKYKVHFHVTQAPPCVWNDTRDVDEILDVWTFVLGDGEVEGKTRWRLPLVFDLEVDPGEARPIVVTEEEKGLLLGYLEEKLHDIETSFRSTVDYRNENDRMAWPCCNAESPACCCVGGVCAAPPS